MMSKTQMWSHALALALATGALCLSVVAMAQPAPMDAAALQSIATANQKTANALELATCASERAAVASAASGCTDTVCRISIAGFAALTPCAALRVQGINQAQAAPAPQIIQTQRDVSVGERIVGLFAGGVGKIFDTAIALGPSWLNYKLGTVQSNNQTALGIVQSQNALGATQSTNGTFAAFGNNLQGTASTGFAANQGIAASGFASVNAVSASGFATVGQLAARATTQIINKGDGNNVVTGQGNTTQSGSGNRIASPGPCTAGNGGNPASPGDTSAATTTGGSSDCAK